MPVPSTYPERPRQEASAAIRRESPASRRDCNPVHDILSDYQRDKEERANDAREPEECDSSRSHVPPLTGRRLTTVVLLRALGYAATSLTG